MATCSTAPRRRRDMAAIIRVGVGWCPSSTRLVRVFSSREEPFADGPGLGATAAPARRSSPWPSCWPLADSETAHPSPPDRKALAWSPQARNLLGALTGRIRSRKYGCSRDSRSNSETGSQHQSQTDLCASVQPTPYPRFHPYAGPALPGENSEDSLLSSSGWLAPPRTSGRSDRPRRRGSPASGTWRRSRTPSSGDRCGWRAASAASRSPRKETRQGCGEACHSQRDVVAGRNEDGVGRPWPRLARAGLRGRGGVRCSAAARPVYAALIPRRKR